MRNILRDSELNCRFLDRGYVVVPFLDAPAVAQMRRVFDDLHPDKLPAFYPSAMHGDAEYRRKVYAAIRSVSDGNVATIFQDCKVCVASFHSKEPGEKLSEFGLHVDPSFTDECEFVPAVNVWCPLTDVTAGNGCLQVVPGSQHHAFPLRPVSPQGMIGHPFGGVLSLLKAKYAQNIEMAAGEAIIFSCKLLHGSGPNMFPDRRVAFQCIVVPQEARMIHSVMVSPTQAEIFEVDESFFWSHRLGTRPAEAKSLGLVEHKFTPFKETDILQSPYIRRTPAFRRNWARWIHSWAGLYQ
jgi:hypothetical protein